MEYRLAALLFVVAFAAQAENPPPVCRYHQEAILPVSFEGGGRVLTEGAIRRDHNDQHTLEMIQSMPTMLLGADFLRAHHVLFALSEQRFYFSYLGGKVFRTE